MDLGLKGKTAIVLGGTRGIGRAIAETLAEEGANVALCARNAAQAQEAAAALAAKGVRASGAGVDIVDGAALAQWVETTAKAFGGVDMLISNAGALVQGAHADAWRKNLDLDVLGSLTAFEAARPHLLAAAERFGDASFTMISSVSAAEADAANAYGAIKAAMIHLGHGLARQHASQGLRVNVVSPGTIYFAGGSWGLIETQAPEIFKTALSRNPTGRMGRPEEVARPTVFLASPAASFITGANLLVDGAITRRVNF